MNIIKSLKAGYRYFLCNGKASAGNSYIVNTMFGVFVTICKKLIEVSDAATRAIQFASKNAFSVLFNISVIYKHWENLHCHHQHHQQQIRMT